MNPKRKLLFSAILAINVLVLVVLISSPTRYKVDFSSVLEIWGDVFRDVDRFGLTLTSLSVEREIEIGNGALEHFQLDTGHPRKHYLDEVGQKIAANVSRRGIPYRFHIIAMETPNAFAIPGGHVLVTTGMLNIIESEAELAAILGHEIAHIDLKHCIENLQYQMLLERIVGGDLAQLIGLAYKLAAFGFSEIQEREADRSAIIHMANAGYSPLEAVSLYHRIEVKIGVGSKQQRRTRGPEGELGRAIIDALKDYFATHPATASRMRDIEALFDRNMRTWNGRTFYIGRSNYAGLIARTGEDRKSEHITFSETSSKFLLLRGQTAALAGNPGAAVMLLTKAIEAGHDEVEVYRTRAQAYADLGDHRKAATDAAHIIKTVGALIESDMDKVGSLKDAGDKSGAVRVLRGVIQTYETLLEAYMFWLNLTGVDKERIAKLRDETTRGKLVTLLEIGRLLQELERSENALAMFSKALEIDKLNFDAIDGATSVRLAIKQKENALTWLGELIRDNPEEPELLRIRAKAYRAAGELKRGDREHARYVRFRNDKVPPLSDKSWAELEDFWDNPKYEDYKAFAITADNQSFWYRWRGARWSRSAAANALHFCFKRHVRRCKLYALGNRIVWQLNNEELEAAHDEYERAARQNVLDKIAGFSGRIDDGEWGAHLLRGDSYLKLKQFNKAIADYSAYLETVPGAPDAIYKRGVAHYKSRRYDLALADLKHPSDSSEPLASSDAPIYRAYSNLFLGDLDAALNDFEWWIRYRSSNSYRGLIGRAAVKLAGGDAAGGMQDLRSVMNTKPKSAYYFNEVCLTLLHFGLPTAAKPHCLKANDLRIMDANILDTVAFMYWQRGEMEEARKLLTDAKYVDHAFADPETRFDEYRTLLTTTFLMLKGYKPGMVKQELDDEARTAIRTYQRDHGLPVTGEIDDEFLGHLTPLGFGSFRIEEVPGKLPSERIKVDCARVSRGETVIITVGSGERSRGKDNNTHGTGERFRCNTDGLSVRREDPTVQ